MEGTAEEKGEGAVEGEGAGDATEGGEILEVTDAQVSAVTEFMREKKVKGSRLIKMSAESHLCQSDK